MLILEDVGILAGLIAIVAYAVKTYQNHNNNKQRGEEEEVASETLVSVIVIVVYQADGIIRTAESITIVKTSAETMTEYLIDAKKVPAEENLVHPL